MSKLIAQAPPAACHKLEATLEDLQSIDPRDLAQMTLLLYLIREFEATVLQLKDEDLIHGPVHASIGQEAVAVGCTAASRGFPSVSVPVLSNTALVIVVRVARLSPLVSSTPSSSRRRLAAAWTTGKASESAQGQLATSTDNMAGNALSGSTYCQPNQVPMAIARTATMKVGTSQAGNPPVASRRDCASSSNRPRAETVVS